MLVHNMQVVEKKDRNRRELTTADVKTASQSAADGGALYRKIIKHTNVIIALPDRLVPSRLRFDVVPVKSAANRRRTLSIVVLFYTTKLRFSMMARTRFDFTTNTWTTVLGCLSFENKGIKGES